MMSSSKSSAPMGAHPHAADQESIGSSILNKLELHCVAKLLQRLPNFIGNVVVFWVALLQIRKHLGVASLDIQNRPLMDT